MGSAMDALRKDIYGPTKKDAAAAEAYLVKTVGLKPDRIRKIIRMTPYMGDDPVKAVEGTLERIAKGNTGFGNIDFDAIDSIGAEEEYLRQILLDRGVSEADADKLLANTKITDNRRENIRRLAQTANRQQIDIGQEKRGWPGGAIGEDRDVEAEKQSLARILTEHGATPDEAQRILDTASITGTNRRVNLGYLRRAARQEGVSIDWPEAAAESTDSLLSAVDATLTPSVNALGNWFASRPTPGGVAGLVFVMVVLWFAVIKVSGKMTRLELIWRTLTGDADLTLTNEQQQQLNTPVPSMVESVEKIIADVGRGLENAPGALGETAKDIAKLKDMEQTAGTAIHDFEQIMLHKSPIGGQAPLNAPPMTPGFDARNFQGYRP